MSFFVVFFSTNHRSDIPLFIYWYLMSLLLFSTQFFNHRGSGSRGSSCRSWEKQECWYVGTIIRITKEICFDSIRCTNGTGDSNSNCYRYKILSLPSHQTLTVIPNLWLTLLTSAGMCPYVFFVHFSSTTMWLSTFNSTRNNRTKIIFW